MALVDVHFEKPQDNGSPVVVGYGGDEEKKLRSATYKFSPEGRAKVPDYVLAAWQELGLAIKADKPQTK